MRDESPAEPARPGSSGTYGYRPWLDGVRALAVLAVLLFHHTQFHPDDNAAWAGGFLGVDVFFVVSGHLITSLLLLEAERDGAVSLRGFWSRRIKRLFPALLVMLGFVAVLARWALPAYELDRLRGGALAALFYVANWHQIDAPASAVSHTWSLAVEEQWYLIWPLALVALLRVLGTRRDRLPWIVGAAYVGSLVWTNVLIETADRSRVYYGTDSRAQSLLLGATVATVLATRREASARPAGRGLDGAALLALAGLGVMFWMVPLEDTATMRFAVPGLGALVVVVLLAGERGAATTSRVLGWGPLPWIGRISYGLYLFHWPVYWWLRESRTDIDGVRLLALRLVVTTAIAVPSYLLVEQPLRRWSGPTRRMVVAVPAASVVMAVGLVGATRTSADAAALGRLGLAFATARDAGPVDAPRWLLVGDQAALVMAGPTPTDVDGTWVAAMGSYACDVLPGRAIVGGAARPVAPGCDSLLPGFGVAAESFEPDVVVVLLGASALTDRRIGGRDVAVGSSELARVLRQRWDELQSLTDARGRRLVLALPPCRSPGAGDEEARRRWLREVADDWADAHADVTVVEPAQVQCPDGSIPADGASPWFEGNALTPYGVDETWRWLITS